MSHYTLIKGLIIEWEIYKTRITQISRTQNTYDIFCLGNPFQIIAILYQTVIVSL